MLPIAFKIKPTSLYCNSVLTIANGKSDEVDLDVDGGFLVVFVGGGQVVSELSNN